MKRPYNDADLLAFSQEHLWYEVWMFYEMVDALTRQTPRPDPHPRIRSLAATAKASTELSRAVSSSRHAGRDSTDRPSARRPPGVRQA
jgi:hypothetical protein